MAGIVSPNDENCYVTERNGQFTYDKFKLIDYPSIAQINRQIAKNAVNVIFAVPESVEETYRDLSNRLYGTTVGRLTDGSNIVKLIQEQYNVSKIYNNQREWNAFMRNNLSKPNRKLVLSLQCHIGHRIEYKLNILHLVLVNKRTPTVVIM